MTQQHSFLGTVRKQMHNVHTITRLLVIENCPPINVWQFFLFDWLYFDSVMLLRAKTTVFYFRVALTNFHTHSIVRISRC